MNYLDHHPFALQKQKTSLRFLHASALTLPAPLLVGGLVVVLLDLDDLVTSFSFVLSFFFLLSFSFGAFQPLVSHLFLCLALLLSCSVLCSFGPSLASSSEPVPVLRFPVPLPLVVGSLKTVDCKPVSFVRKTILSSFSFCETSFVDRAHCRQVWILYSWLLLFSCCWCLFLCCCCWFLFCCSLGSCPASDFFLQLFNLFLILCSFLQKAFHHLLQLLDPVVFLAAAAFLSFSCRFCLFTFGLLLCHVCCCCLLLLFSFLPGFLLSLLPLLFLLRSCCRFCCCLFLFCFCCVVRLLLPL